MQGAPYPGCPLPFTAKKGGKVSNLDPDSDIYGRHAATPTHPVGLSTQFWDRLLTVPWAAFTYRAPGAAPVTSHAARPGHPAGVYFERAGVVHFERFSWKGGFEKEWRVRELCRFGEKPLKKLTSRD